MLTLGESLGYSYQKAARVNKANNPSFLFFYTTVFMLVLTE